MELRAAPDRILVARKAQPAKIGSIHVPENANWYGNHGNHVTGVAVSVGSRAFDRTSIREGDTLLLHPHLAAQELDAAVPPAQAADWRKRYDLPEKMDIISLHAGGINRQGQDFPGEIVGHIEQKKVRS